MGIKQLYNDNLRKLPNEYGDVSVMYISILLTKHVKYTYLYLFKFVLYSIVAFKAN